MKKKQALHSILVGAAILVSAGAAAAAQDGFYGGVAVRDSGAQAIGLTLGKAPFVWSRFTSPVAEDSSQRALVFGGYRWANDVSIEAAFNSNDKYALHPAGTGIGGVGLGLSDPIRTWNVDLYTNWEFIHSLSLYGRLGYAQTDGRPLLAQAGLSSTDPRRLRDGVNYGVGLRYDLSRLLGMRVEYARFNRFGGESTSTGVIPDSDQVTFGIQFKF